MLTPSLWGPVVGDGLLLAGALVLYVRTGSRWALLLGAGAALTLVSIALGVVFAPSAVLDAGGNVIEQSAPPAWIWPITAWGLALGRVASGAGLLGAAAEMPKPRARN